jgi:hypothetical protein
LLFNAEEQVANEGGRQIGCGEGDGLALDSLLKACHLPQAAGALLAALPVLAAAGGDGRLGLLQRRLRPQPLVLQGRALTYERCEITLLLPKELLKRLDLGLVLGGPSSLGQACLEGRAIGYASA